MDAMIFYITEQDVMSIFAVFPKKERPVAEIIKSTIGAHIRYGSQAI